jgi:hypothetical protein
VRVAEVPPFHEAWFLRARFVRHMRRRAKALRLEDEIKEILMGELRG